MRGKPIARSADGAPRGNIPAYAGKTLSWLVFADLIQEHPRVCGENLERLIRAGVSNRNIPAYAGKTAGIAWHAGMGEEHPRVCGENAFTWASSDA